MSYYGGELRPRQSAQYPYSSLFVGGARSRSSRGGYGTKASAKMNPWIQHVKRYAAAHRVPYGVALMKAGASYHAPRQRR